MSSDSPSYSKSRPFLASIKERISLTKPGSQKDTQHVVLDLSGSGIQYAVGDCVGVIPANHPEVVNHLLKALKATGEEPVKDKSSGEEISLRDYLTHKTNLARVPKELLTALHERQTNVNKKEYLAHLLAPEQKEALKHYLEVHEVWDALEEFHEALLSPQELCDMLSGLLPRFYSIASSQKVVGDEVHLTVRKTVYTTNSRLRRGVCTHFICDIVPLEHTSVPIYIQPTHSFNLPKDASAPIIMVGPGTGIAPYRAFMQERMAQGAPGGNWLFFGEWNRAYDFFYEDYWRELQSQGKLRLEVAFSRDQEHKLYVQHRMLEHAADLWRWLEEGAYLFVCGDAKVMAKDVEAALSQIIREQGQLDESGARAYIKRLRTEKRYLRDVY
jgi:sulfite reductase (NADPH) flavoprotein alpha-component